MKNNLGSGVKPQNDKGCGKKNIVTPAPLLVTPAQAGVGLYSVRIANQK